MLQRVLVFTFAMILEYEGGMFLSQTETWHGSPILHDTDEIIPRALMSRLANKS